MVRKFNIENTIKSVSRYFTPKVLKPIPRDVHEKAFKMTLEHFSQGITNCRVLSNEEAEGRIDHKTASGYHWKFDGTPTKDLFYARPDIKEILKEDWKACKHDPDYGSRTVYDQIDKEEILPQEKLDKGDIRGIMCPPADHLHTGMRLFGDMNQQFHEQYLQTASCVGLPKTGGVWNRFVNKLAKHKYGFAGDESKWDATLPAILMEVCRDIRICWLPSQKERITHYYDAIIDTIIRLPNGWLLQKLRGNPSGSVNTSDDNTIALFYLMAVTWIMNVSDNYDEFMEAVAMVLYGDDNTCTVADEYLSVFNLKTIGATMDMFGVVLKNPNDPPKSYKDLDFLSQKWKQVNGMWLPYAIDPDKLKAGMYYVDREYQADVVMQASMIMQYIETNPFDKEFVDHCDLQLEELYKHLHPNDVRKLKKRYPTYKKMMQLYTGFEKRTNQMDPIVRPGRNFNSTSPFKGMSESSNTPLYTEPAYSKSDVKRGEKIIDSPLLTEEAREWLIRALDPYHDTTVPPKGYPDMTTVGTVVQEINMSATVGAPTSAGGGLWDAHIFNMAHIAGTGTDLNVIPVLFDPQIGQMGAYGSGYVAGMNATGLQVITCPNGAHTMPNPALATMATTVTASLNPIQYLSGKFRVVGMGFEVINTTAEINLQGLCTAYRMPQQNNIMQIAYANGAAPSNSMAVARVLSMPPDLVGDALQLPSSKQWPAKYGSYSVCTMMAEDNSFECLDNKHTMYLGSRVAGITTTYPALCNFNVPAPNTKTLPFRWYSPYNTSGVFYTGLSPETTLQVNFKILVETAPGPNDILNTLAQPSPQLCKMAIELYGDVIARLPVGVPYTENPDGEWFSTVLGGIGTLANTLGFINPMFSMVGTGFGVAKSLYDNISKQMDKKIDNKVKNIDEHVKKKMNQINNSAQVVRYQAPVDLRLRSVPPPYGTGVKAKAVKKKETKIVKVQRK